MLTVGARIPKFELLDQDGKYVSSSELVGTRCVFYFYPKDFTPGCTTEADEFSKIYKDFKKNDIRIIGLSPDNDSSHKKFCTKMSIPYTLLADTEHSVSELFGVWSLKKFMGREYMGVNRSTFLCDKKGIIIQIYEKVKPAGHAALVLEYFKTAQ